MCTVWQITDAHRASLQRYAQTIELERMAGKSHAEACYGALMDASLRFEAQLVQLLGEDECDSSPGA